MSHDPVHGLPLEGLRVLDLSRVLAGPLATMMLGDLGADVLKVERPGGGDDTRAWGPPFAEDGQSAYFRAINRNKRSVALDLAHPPDRELLLKLAADADVVVDNFLPGLLARFGIDVDAVVRANERLIWCSIAGFINDADRPAYDLLVQAEAGWMAITGPADGAPHKVGVALADVIAGKDAVAAVLAALVARGAARAPLAPARRRLRVGLQHSATAALVNVAQGALLAATPPARWGNAHPHIVPYELFPTADRPLVLAVGTDAQWQTCLDAIEAPASLRHPSWSTNAGRVRHRDALVRALGAHLATRPAADWLARLAAARVPAGLVRSVAEALADVDADARSGIASAVGGRTRTPPPALDEFGDAVRAHGWSAFHA